MPTEKEIANEALEILTQLVQLKELKDKHGETDIYLVYKPNIWKKAFAFVNLHCPNRPRLKTDKENFESLLESIKQGKDHQFVFDEKDGEAQCRCGRSAYWIKIGYICNSFFTDHPCKYETATTPIKCE